MNLEQIAQRHLPRLQMHSLSDGLTVCGQCGQLYPCDAMQAAARVEELEAALRGHGLATCTCGRVYCLISDGETIHCRCGAMLSAATSIVRASLPVREET